MGVIYQLLYIKKSPAEAGDESYYAGCVVTYRSPVYKVEDFRDPVVGGDNCFFFMNNSTTGNRKKG